MTIRAQILLLGTLLACLFWAFSAEAVRPRGVVTPGDRLFIAGLDAYEDSNYDAALKYFTDAATWGIKDAQFNIGVMHYHGQGIEQDLVRAYAWFAVAAERGRDVKKVQVRDETFELLTRDQREQAFDTVLQLMQEYGDENTLGRVKHWYRQQRRSTGSRVGYAGLNSQIWARGPGGNFAPYTNVEYEEKKFAGSHAVPEGWVEFGDLEFIDDDEEANGDDEFDEPDENP